MSSAWGSSFRGAEGEPGIHDNARGKRHPKHLFRDARRHESRALASGSPRKDKAWCGWLLAGAALALAGCGREVPPSPTCLVRGIDVSRHQDVIDWPAVARAGIAFAWIKATEGGDHLDPAFRRNWALAGAAGVRRGAYHFVYWCRRAADQARWFVANVPDDPAALPPVLDVEWNPESRTCPGTVPREKALGEMRTILAAMERATGRRPIIYAPRDFFAQVMDGQAMDGELAGYPLWVRGLGRTLPAEYGGRPWIVWQHSETGRVPGISGDVDLDCAEGRVR